MGSGAYRVRGYCPLRAVIEHAAGCAQLEWEAASFRMSPERRAAAIEEAGFQAFCSHLWGCVLADREVA